ncbi:uncharacterized protein LOC128558808 [Mercenaria mercenaria]|uniref:uncharacterized protein LOC128558808 n=1 Tax=Mercenaria mercenaria TaxID=6596 RepID=UPI00234E5614|nr:uncharacterized protein LOC128558808 [Mercenaria mercenaria]
MIIFCSVYLSCFSFYLIRSLTELEEAQLNFYEENKSQRKVAEQQVKTLAVQEEFFKLTTKTLAEKNDLSGILDLFYRTIKRGQHIKEDEIQCTKLKTEIL